MAEEAHAAAKNKRNYTIPVTKFHCPLSYGKKV